MIKPSRSLQITALGIGFAFLYIPIISLVVYSFNDSPLVTVWTEFSLKWYRALWSDDELINAAWLSLRIAFLTACASVVIGTWAGFVLARMGRFRGFTLYTGMINAPLVIPEVIQGISLLLLFVEMAKLIGWPAGRGIFTIWIGHVMLCISYVAIIVESRVRELNPSLEEAALDLGATRCACSSRSRCRSSRKRSSRAGCCRSRCLSTTSCCRRSCPDRDRLRCRSSCFRACVSA